MSAALLLPFDAANETLPRKKFTREEVDRLTAEGFFEGQRYELIDGDLIDKMGQKPSHGSTIQRILTALSKIFDVGLLRVQMAMEASAADRERSLPEPDLAVLAQWKNEYDIRDPRGDECLLVVEVSNTTVKFDLSRKAALYASAAVREYWVMDLTRRILVVHRQPRGESYRVIQIFSESDTVSLEGRTETIRIADLLPTVPDTER